MSDHDCLKRSRIRFSKEPVFVFNSQFDVDTHFRQNPFKTILTHSNKPTKCTVIHDQNMPAHQMSIRYRLCVSSKCQEADPTDDEKCPYKAKEVYCFGSSQFFIFESPNAQHLNKFFDRIDKFQGIHPFYEKEIERIYNENTKTPMEIWIALRNNLKNPEMKYR
jgi:hypothetical protein